MFEINDVIFYPAYGVGKIDSIDQKTKEGKDMYYYSLHLLNNPMKVILPINLVENAHLRLVSDSNSIDNALQDLHKNTEKTKEILSCSYKERRETFLNKIKTGSVNDYLEVIVSLTELKSKHDLNSTERQFLYKAKKIIIEEICASKNISKDEACDLLEDSIKC